MQVPWPISTAPGERPQEGAGRLINVFAEPRGEGFGPVWRRVPGAAVFARDPSEGLAVAGSFAAAISSVLEMVGGVAGHATALADGDSIVLVLAETAGVAEGHAEAAAEWESINDADGVADGEAFAFGFIDDAAL